MAITFNPALSFQASRPNPVIDTEIKSESVNSTVPVMENPKVSPVRGVLSNIAKAFVSTTQMTQATIKAVVYGFITGSIVAGYKYVTTAIPAAFKEGGSIIETLEHPARSIGWKGNFMAGVAALGVASYHIMRGMLKTNQGTANVDHQLYTGHRDV